MKTNQKNNFYLVRFTEKNTTNIEIPKSSNEIKSNGNKDFNFEKLTITTHIIATISYACYDRPCFVPVPFRTLLTKLD